MLAVNYLALMLICVPIYADDLVLLAPSWVALQRLLDAAEAAASKINMTFNTRKTVCMAFNPASRSKRVADSFPVFTLCNSQLVSVDQFKYLGHCDVPRLDVIGYC